MSTNAILRGAVLSLAALGLSVCMVSVALGQDPGSKIKIERVLLISDGNGVEVGKPLIEGAVVTLEVVGHERGEKIRVGTYKRRKKYRRKIGYRDTLTRVKILGIEMPHGEKREKHGA